MQDSNYGVEQLAAELKAMDDSDTSPRKFTNAVVVLKNAHGMVILPLRLSPIPILTSCAVWHRCGEQATT